MLKHLLCIMDGNRRWAHEHGVLLEKGYKEGAHAVKRVVEFCLKEAIPFLSLYAFSTENFNRSEQEKQLLFSYLTKEAQDVTRYFIHHNVNVTFIGNRNLFPSSVIRVCNDIERRTKNCLRIFVRILLGYGGRQEIVAGTKSVITKVQQGMLHIDSLDEDEFSRHLWTSSTPDPDLIIRTGGYKRLSNCLLFQAAYSELFFIDCLWPDITVDVLQQAVCSFKKSKRNFGR